jgi:hypothetical protein
MPAPHYLPTGAKIQAQNGIRNGHSAFSLAFEATVEFLTKFLRWHSPENALTTASSTNIEEGTLADLLLVDGNPIENITLIEDPTKNFVVIMKDGTIFKNLLAQ